MSIITNNNTNNNNKWHKFPLIRTPRTLAQNKKWMQPNYRLYVIHGVPICYATPCMPW